MFTQSRAGRGGGVAIAYKKHVKVNKVTSRVFKAFEHVECLVKSDSNDLLRVCCLYRSGSSSNVTEFCIDFDNYLEYLINLPGKLLICGDFNIHMEDSDCPHTKRFQTTLSNYGLIQHISKPTHIHGGTLDLVLTRSNACDSLSISNIRVVQTVTSSDHYFVGFSCKFDYTPSTEQTVVKARNLKDVDLACLKTDILSSDIGNPEKFINCNTALSILKKELHRLLDKHSPMKEFKINPHQDVWIDTKCQEARRLRRKAERMNKRLKTPESKLAWKNASQHANSVIDSTMHNFYSDKFSLCNNDKKKTYQLVNDLMDRESHRNCHPNDKPSHIVASEMQKFFEDKVKNIYTEIKRSYPRISKVNDNSSDFRGEHFTEFSSIDETQLTSIISELNKKNCELDPLPIKLFLECLDVMKPILLFIVNDSLKTGIFPEDLKHALVKPSIKDQSKDINEYSNYRPISNLSFVSKIIEKCVQKQLSKHLKDNNLHAEHQSGYRADHSCETATLAIYNDLLCVTEAKNKVVLLLLDLSAAFDTVNHSMLLSKLQKKFGISGNVLKWFTSYLQDRSFTVTIDNSQSKKCYIRIGVPQGSILGPVLFILYTKEIESIARKYGFKIHMFADDNQLYIEFNPLVHNMDDIERQIIHCLSDIKAWMTTNNLCLNSNKTEAIIVKQKNVHDTTPLDPIKLNYNGECIQPSTGSVKSLGVLFDQFLSFEDHVNSVVKACNIHLRNLRVIGQKLSFDMKKKLIHCLVFTRLDYCNAMVCFMASQVVS